MANREVNLTKRVDTPQRLRCGPACAQGSRTKRLNNGVSVMPDKGQKGHRSLAASVEG
jgi:hypothetical protein